MFKVMRQAKIKEILLDRNQVDVQTLSAMLNVSSVTIRNDLEALESQGMILRTHGGAVLNDSYNRERTLTVSPPTGQVEYDKYKDNIAQVAAQLIKDNEWVFLGPGATCGFLAKCLAQRDRLNLVTNNLYATSALAATSGLNVIVAGGNLYSEGMFLGGDMFNLALRSIHVSKAFISVAGVDMKNGLSVSSFAELNVFNQVREIADQMVILADHSKFDAVSFTRIGGLDSVHTLISNENIPEAYKAFFFEHGVKLFTPYEIRNSSVQVSG